MILLDVINNVLESIRANIFKVFAGSDELIDLINMYLANPEIDREGRRKIVEQECGPNHGDAGEKIAHRIMGIINNRKLQ